MMSELRPVAQDLIKRVDDFIQTEIAHNNLFIMNSLKIKMEHGLSHR